MSKLRDEPKGRIINIMADGRIVEDLTGHVIPFTPETEGAYRVMARFAQRRAREQANASPASPPHREPTPKLKDGKSLL